MSSLKRKGFQQGPSTNHEFFRFHIEGKVAQVRTHVSHGHQEVNKGSALFSAMARQLYLSNAELARLFDCLSHKPNTSKYCGEKTSSDRLDGWQMLAPTWPALFMVPLLQG